ncbi:MAG: hypothetical protein LH647_07915 [Leptolyngbyaceae cyanobacterium CAN_BIN12]|nr:hypothetical protein [Leptolyngbyaceae cyanobacterium CAN_BIN12]
MNTKLVESLVQIIESLSSEERQILEERLNRKRSWEETKQQLTQIHAQITARRGGKPLDISTEDISELIHQMREERTQQLMEAISPLEKSE